MKYFAYGSNMLLARLRERVPSATVVSMGALLGHKLKFHKVSCDGSGKCDAWQTNDEADVVYGVIYDISKNEKIDLDIAEGLGGGYDEKTVSVYVKPEKTIIEAVTYYATDLDADLQPYHWYKNFVLKGAIENALPEHHIEFIRSIESVADTNVKRTILNETILSKSNKE